MRELHRGANLQKQADAIPYAQTPLVAVFVDGFPVDILQNQVGIALAAYAAIQQPCDMGMIQAREELPLHRETVSEKLASQVRAQDLERHLPVELPVAAMRQVHRPHPSDSQQGIQLIV